MGAMKVRAGQYRMLGRWSAIALALGLMLMTDSAAAKKIASYRQDSQLEALLNAPFQPELLDEDTESPDNAAGDGGVKTTGVITANDVNQAQLTIPSLWYTRDQIAEQFNPLLVENWLAYPDAATAVRRVDIVVNAQPWSLLDYMERYTVLNQFGTAARDYLYSVRIFNTERDFLGAYFCKFEPTLAANPTLVGDRGAIADASTCTVERLDAFGAGGIRGQNNSGFGASSP
ncbi:MAG: hypothetical protein ACTS2F_00655 [Thainema sp.]